MSGGVLNLAGMKEPVGNTNTHGMLIPDESVLKLSIVILLALGSYCDWNKQENSFAGSDQSYLV